MALQQGQLDGACDGIYAFINAARAVCPGRGASDWDDIYKEIVQKAGPRLCKSLPPAGTDSDQILKLADVVGSVLRPHGLDVLEASVYEDGTHPDICTFMSFLKINVNPEKVAAVFGFNHFDRPGHWTVAKDTTDKRVILHDSEGMVHINQSSMTAGRSTMGRPYGIDGPVFLVKRGHVPSTASPQRGGMDGGLRDLCDAELDALVQLDIDAEGDADSLSRDVDLRAYSTEISEKLRATEQEAIACTIEEGERFAGLWSDIDACDGILGEMEQNLLAFCKNINSVTDDIQHMQHEVAAIQTRLSNRRAVEEEISKILNAALVPPAVIDELANSEITDTFVHHIERVASCRSEVHKLNSPVVSQQVIPAIDALTITLSAKIRTFLLSKIALLSKPKTNIPIIQQNVLLRYKPLMTYLLMNNGVVGQEVKDTYVSALRHIYHKKVKSFLGKLTKLEKPMLGAKDLITVVRKADPVHDIGLYMSSQSRDDWVANWDAPIVVPYVEKEKNRMHPYENLFRTMHLMLLDIITSEYIFSYDFFSDKNLFIPMFQKVVTLLRDSVAAAVPNIYDFLTLTTCIRLTNLFKGIMAQRAIHCVDGYLESTLLTLWTQLEAVIKLNLQALSGYTQHPVRVVGAQVIPLTSKFANFTGVLLSCFNAGVAAPPAKPGASADGTRQQRGGGGGGANTTPPATPPHATEHHDRVKVLEVMVSSTVLEMNRAINIDPTQGQRSERERQLFLAANLSQVQAVWASYGVDPSCHDAATVTGWLEGAKSTLISLLIEYYLPEFVECISSTECKIRVVAAEQEELKAQKDAEEKERGGAGASGGCEEGEGEGEGGLICPDTSEHDKYRAAIDEAAILKCAEGFGKSWQTRIPLAVKEVLSKVTFALAEDISSRLVMQVAMYNERLKNILTQCWLNPPCRNWLVPNNALLGAVNTLVEEYHAR